jgi:hypothetical protein
MIGFYDYTSISTNCIIIWIATTETDQSVKQKNTGSGDSANFNCGENLIKAGVEDQECEFED